MTGELHCTTCGAALSGQGPGAPPCPACAFRLALNHGAAPESVEGERVGPYRLRRILGEGGMGIVWEALQEEPVRRRVALKRIRLGMDSSQVLARFDSERQALALMTHPNIAQVLDAGRTPDGRPYFAMEFVEGAWITHHADAQRLSIRARLDLFLQVCQGVQHAHHKGVIHRDVKPSNVLIRTEQGQPIPKIIDFGVAKAMGEHLGGRTPVTRLGQRIGTPEYMSPEQAGPAGFDVDTRTDVYSLGVLLYELLVGRLPFEAPGGDQDALRRSIREDDPARPSARFTDPGGDAEEIARRRGTDPAGLRRQVQGDLDWIVLKGMARDRGRRYGTPDELAADLKRHLADEPVLAGPPSTAYRVGKFARRHTVGVAAAAVVALVLLVTAVGMSIQARRIALERDRANKEARTAGAALDFLTDTFRLSDPEQVRGETITAREILDRGAAKIERQLQGTPEVEAALMLTIGRTYVNLGLFDRAEPLVRRAMALRGGTAGPRHPLTSEAAIELSSILRQRGSLDEAESLAREVLAARGPDAGAADAPAAGDTLLAGAEVRLGEVLIERGRLEEAEPHLQAGFDGMTRALGPDDRDTLRAATALADCLSRRGRYGEAEPLFRRTLEAQRRLYGSDDPNTIVPLNGLAINARRAGNNAEAEALFRESLQTLRKVVGDDHPSTYTAASNLGIYLVEMGRLDEAEPLLREALDGRRRLGGTKSAPALGTLTEWAALRRDQGRLDEAESAFREALAGFRGTLGPDHPQTMRVQNNLGSLLKDRGRLNEAEPYYRASLDSATRVLGAEHPNTLTAMGNLGELLALQGKPAEALPLLTTSLEGTRKALPPTHVNVGIALRKYGLCLTGLRRFTEAESSLLQAYEVTRAAVGESHYRTKAVVRDLIGLYDAWGKPDQAAHWKGLAAAAAT